MRRLATSRTAVVLAGTLGALGTSNGAALAAPPIQEASCGPAYGDPAFVLRGPTQLAIRRSWTVDLERSGGPGRITPDEGVRVTVGPAQPGAQLATQYANRPPNRFGEWPLRLATGNGPALISAAWPETRSEFSNTPPFVTMDYQCTRTASVIAHPIMGSRPVVTHGVDLVPPSYDSLPQFTFHYPRSCATAAVGPVTLTVRDGRVTRRLRLSDQCDYWQRKHATTRVWSLLGVDSKTGNERAYLRMRIHRSDLRILHYQVIFHGRTVDSGGLRAQTDHSAQRTIYEGTDDFINVCINGSYTIWSKNGRLYCVVPAFTDYEYRFVSGKKTVTLRADGALRHRW